MGHQSLSQKWNPMIMPPTITTSPMIHTALNVNPVIMTITSLKIILSDILFVYILTSLSVYMCYYITEMLQFRQIYFT